MIDYPALLNYVANHPDVLPNVAPGYAAIDLAGFFAEPRNVMFGDENGLILFVLLPDGETFEMHWLLTRAIRGKAALGMARNAVMTMFTSYDCCAIVGATPRENLAARRMNRALGGLPVGVSQDSQGRPCINYKLERRRWAKSSAVS